MIQHTPDFVVPSWQLFEPVWLHGVWLVPLLAILSLATFFQRKRRLERFADPIQHESLVGRRAHGWTVIRSVVIATAILLVSVAASRPQSDPESVPVEERGRQVVFLLDVSRSMLARDVAPSRLERAKLWINDLVDELHSDRFALVAFAGSSSVRAPLSSDRPFFRLTLEELDPNSVDLGGTNIGDAIRRTMDLVVPESPNGDNVPTDIILISDGEDQESLPLEAASAAAQRGARVIALGIGSRSGARVPESDSGPGGSGRVVSRLEGSTLAGIAAATPGGVYIEVGTGTIDLAELYRDVIASADQTTLAVGETTRYQERFMWFAWPALVLLLIDRIILPQRTSRHRPSTRRSTT